MYGADGQPSSFLAACRGGRAGDATPRCGSCARPGRSLPEYRLSSGRRQHARHRPAPRAGSRTDPAARPPLPTSTPPSSTPTSWCRSRPSASGSRSRRGRDRSWPTRFARHRDLDRLRPVRTAAEDAPWVAETIAHPGRRVPGARDRLRRRAVHPGQLPGRRRAVAGPRADQGAHVHRARDLWAALMDRLADMALSSLRDQVAAGAAAVQLFDSWVGTLSPSDYRTHVLPASRRIFAGLAELGVPAHPLRRRARANCSV